MVHADHHPAKGNRLNTYRNKSKKNDALRCSLAVERLETRDVPSSLGLSFDLSIHETQVTFSPLGLPSSMSGDIYYGDTCQGPVAGHYQESLTPIFYNGQFVGTTGSATFTLYAAWNPNLVMETITTADTSYITGVDPANGALLVATTGTITASSGW